METLLITGAAGNIGALLRPLLARPGRVLRLFDIAPVPDPGPGEEVVAGSVTDPAALAAATAGVDAVLHLGGLSQEAPWADLLAVNVEGSRNVLQAAADAGVPRVLLASSGHAVGYRTRAEAPLPADAPPLPDGFYGWSKAALESLGALYQRRYPEMTVFCLRIGACFPQPDAPRALTMWLSPADAARLVEACLSTPERGLHHVWGVSANTQGWLSHAGGEAIGYFARDDSEAWADRLGSLTPDDPDYHVLGGPYGRLPLGVRP
ncbi:NAD(P)-dependent oxidoreductase [Longispora sp. NPDC051575]|uniref:NAD-dependent epimerase/dehydratase family protein n=1 Tax=Longispora sp. NPDC051575 TaxID=3154943 RepID=UPI0034307363